MQEKTNMDEILKNIKPQSKVDSLVEGLQTTIEGDNCLEELQQHNKKIQSQLVGD